MAQFVGIVVGTQMMKTAKVEVSRMMLHPHVLKYVKRRKKFLCHDPESTCRVGDLVMIQECQRMSTRMNFVVSQVLEKSPAHLAEIELDRQRQQQEQCTVDTATDGASSS